MQRYSLLAALVVSVASATESVRTRFLPHQHDIELNVFQGPQLDWKADLELALKQQSFGIILHGVVGAGKSRLVEALNGLQPNSISGQAPSGNTAHTQTTTSYSDLHDDQLNHRLHVIDTVGFGLVSDYEKLIALESIDDTYKVVTEHNIPIKRIYFMVDCYKTANALPQSIAKNIAILALVYGIEAVRQIRFIVSKCDRLAGRYQQKSQFLEIHTALSKLYREAFDKELEETSKGPFELDPNRILFISAKPGAVDMRHLTDDLIAASSEPDLVLNGTTTEVMFRDLDFVIGYYRIRVKAKQGVLKKLQSKQGWNTAGYAALEIAAAGFSAAGALIKVSKYSLNIAGGWAFAQQCRKAGTFTKLAAIGMSTCDNSCPRSVSQYIAENKTILEAVKEQRKILMNMAGETDSEIDAVLATKKQKNQS